MPTRYRGKSTCMIGTNNKRLSHRNKQQAVLPKHLLRTDKGTMTSCQTSQGNGLVTDISLGRSTAQISGGSISKGNMMHWITSRMRGKASEVIRPLKHKVVPYPIIAEQTASSERRTERATKGPQTTQA